MAYYGLAGNLVLFLNTMPFSWVSYNAVSASLFFFGLCFVTSLLGGWLADTFLGHFKALLVGFLIYAAGYVFMPLLASDTLRGKPDDESKYAELPHICWNISSRDADDNINDPFDEACSGTIFLALSIIAIGSGVVRVNIAPFGSDQVCT
jgi:dipeptide/tripeptide permease